MHWQTGVYGDMCDALVYIVILFGANLITLSNIPKKTKNKKNKKHMLPLSYCIPRSVRKPFEGKNSVIGLTPPFLVELQKPPQLW
jgi:hypothetical protein